MTELPIWLALLIDVFAAYRLTRLVVKDAFPPIKKARDWMLRRWPAADAVFEEDDIENGYIRGTRRKVYATEEVGMGVDRPIFRYAAETHHWFGDLITCPWCAGMYVAAGVVAMRELVYWWPYLALVLAYSALVGLISMGMKD